MEVFIGYGKEMRPLYYMNSTDAAEYLGVSDRTVRELCRTRQLEHERLNGRNIRIKKEWLDDYLNKIRVKPVEKGDFNHD